MQQAENRAIKLWQTWEAKEKMLMEVFGGEKSFGGLDREKFAFLSAGLDRLSPLASPDEKLVAGLIQKSLRRLEKQLYPNRVLRFVNRVKRRVFDRPVARWRLASSRKANVAALDARLEKLGIDPARLDLGKALDFEREVMDFRLSSPIGTDKRFEMMLHLKKDDGGRFQFSGYTGKLEHVSDTALNKVFRFDAGLDLSSREALNLLEGRAVMKDASDGFGEQRWMQLDFSSGTGLMREFGKSAGFDLRDEMEKMSELLKQPALNEAYVLRALERGNQVVVNRPSGEKLFLEADALSGKIVVRDAKRMEVVIEKLLRKREKSMGLTAELKISRPRQKQQEQVLGIA